MLEASREIPKGYNLLHCSDRNTQQTAWKHWLLAAAALRRLRPATTVAQNQLNWQQVREMCPVPPTSISKYTQCYSSTFLPGEEDLTQLCVLKDIHLLPKGGKRKGEEKPNIRTSCKCSRSTGWNRVFLCHQSL